MEIGGPYDGSSDLTLLLPTENLPSSDSFWISTSSPSFQGSSSMVNFENSPGENAAVRPYLSPLDNEENGNEEDNDRSFHQQEKKRRLSVDQVRFLERSFEIENKLGPERKVQLAKEIGLQPRQIAIWFQNRRARYKTKQLEKDYDSLKANYDELKADHDTLFKENENLKNEVRLLTEKLQGKEKSEPGNPIVPLDAELDQKPILGTIPQSAANLPMVVCKQEAVYSSKSDVFDSESIESSHHTNVKHPSLLEPANSSHVFELDQSDFSQDEEDNFSKNLMSLPCLPKLEDGCYNYPVEDQAFWFWPY